VELILGPTGEHGQLKLIPRKSNDGKIYLKALVGYNIGHPSFIEFVRVKLARILENGRTPRERAVIGWSKSVSGVDFIIFPREESLVIGGLHNLFLEPKEGFLALAIEQRHVDSKDP
jgi:hypothetical protein